MTPTVGTADRNPGPISALIPDDEVRALLTACDLPTVDLDAQPGLELYGCRDTSERIVAMVGLEPAGRDVLLRSLAVEPAHRGRGLAALLLAFAEERAAASGYACIHLLTTSAVAYFANHGYKYKQRDHAPAGVRATAQFSELCPATAQYMTKTVTGKRT